MVYIKFVAICCCCDYDVHGEIFEVLDDCGRMQGFGGVVVLVVMYMMGMLCLLLLMLWWCCVMFWPWEWPRKCFDDFWNGRFGFLNTAVYFEGA